MQGRATAWVLPPQVPRSITSDRGSEFIDRPHLKAEVGTRTWLCKAQSLWQKGAADELIADRRREAERE